MLPCGHGIHRYASLLSCMVQGGLQVVLEVWLKKEQGAINIMYFRSNQEHSMSVDFLIQRGLHYVIQQPSFAYVVVAILPLLP